MRFKLLTGPAQAIRCAGCLKECTGGDLSDYTASGRPLDAVYRDDTSNGLYCESCASRIAESQYVDFTRSVNEFYVDTRGEVIR